MSEPVKKCFTGVGVIDALNVILALVFVYGFFNKGARWRRWVGGLTLTIAAYSAVLFAFATLSTGDWAQRPVEYQVIVVAFAPMPVLMVVFSYWLGTGRLNKSEDPADSSADV